MAQRVLQHEAADARAGIERGEDEHRLEHDREVIPEREQALAERVGEDARHADRERRRAAGAREQRASRPSRCASVCICSAVTGKPQPEIVATAASAVAPTTPGALLIAKYTPGSSSVAAIIAMIATHDSSIMLP